MNFNMRSFVTSYC